MVTLSWLPLFDGIPDSNTQISAAPWQTLPFQLFQQAAVSSIQVTPQLIFVILLDLRRGSQMASQ